MEKKAYNRTTMINPFPQTRILDTVTLILVFGSLWLAVIDPSTRPAFGNLTIVVSNKNETLSCTISANNLIKRCGRMQIHSSSL